jgi:hypothetical protein
MTPAPRNPVRPAGGLTMPEGFQLADPRACLKLDVFSTPARLLALAS